MPAVRPELPRSGECATPGIAWRVSTETGDRGDAQIWPGTSEAHPGPARPATTSGILELDRAAAGAPLGDVHEQYISAVPAGQKIDLSDRLSWCERDDPGFDAKAAKIVGLYMASSDNAVVSVDEKPSIRAMERAQRPQAARRQCHDRPIAQRQTQRQDHAVRGPGCGYRQNRS